MKIAVLGSGGWGTALAMLLEENGHQVTLWSYLEQESKQLQATGENPLLPGVKLPAGLSYTWDLDCVVGSDVVVMATPSFGVRSTAEQIAGRLSPGTILVSVSKGIEKGTFLRMSQIIRENVLGDDHRPVEAAAEVGDHCRHHGRQNGAGAPGRQQGNGMFCETHGAYSSLSPRWRTVSRMGVPSRPKVARTWFSRYRW